MNADGAPAYRRPLRLRHYDYARAGAYFVTICTHGRVCSSRRVNELRGGSGTPVWQRGYYEHVIRNDISLHEIRGYIEANPLHWDLDRENPHRRGGFDPDLGKPNPRRGGFKTHPYTQDFHRGGVQTRPHKQGQGQA